MKRIALGVGLVLAVVLGIGGYKMVGTRAQVVAPTKIRYVTAPENPARIPVTLGPARASARLTKGAALKIAEMSSSWGPALADHPFTVQFGSYAAPGFGQKIGSSRQLIGNRDVWRFTLTGLDSVRPCARYHEQDGSVTVVCPPHVHTASIFIDDASGTFLQAIGS